MIIYSSSDWHSEYKKLRNSAKRFIRKVRADADLIVGVGDLFDLMEHSWKKFVNCGAIRELKEELEGKKFIYVPGNHDPKRYVKKIISGPNIKVASRDYRVTLDSRVYHFTHGFQWGLLWPWLAKFSDSLVVVAPPIYRWWLSKVSPRELKEKGEREKYNKITGLIHSGVCQFAEQNDIVVVIGHTHKPWFAGDWESPLMYDGGDMLDSETYLRIEGEQVQRLRL